MNSALSRHSLAALAFAAAALLPVGGATFTVTSAAPTGPGSLGQAILDANAAPNIGGPDRIHFALPALGTTISLAGLPAGETSLPVVTDAVVIDGTTQPGYDFSSNPLTPSPRPVVIIDGALIAGRGALRLAAADCQVWGLGFDRIDRQQAADAPPATLGAITTEGAGSGCLIRWCHFGGTSPFWVNPENRTSVLFKTTGSTVDQCLFFHHTDEAIRCEGGGQSNIITRNWFGLAVFEAQLLTDTGRTFPPAQIRLRAAANIVGAANAGNVIATKRTAIRVEAPNLDNEQTVIENNRIGVTPANFPPAVRGPAFIGISLADDVVDTLIRSNVIAGCEGAAIAVSRATQTTITLNSLGTGPGATEDWGNAYGVLISGFSSRGTISDNTIRHSTNSAISLSENLLSGGIPDQWVFSRNSIAGSGGLGISIGNVTPTPNDPLDADDGVNTLVNHPVITNVTTDGIETTISVALSAAASTRYEVELFHSPVVGAHGHGEGQTWLGTLVLTTNSAGQAAGNFTYFGQAEPGWYAGTATQTFRNPFGGEISRVATSEFGLSRAFGVVEPPPFAITAIRRGVASTEIDFPVQVGWRYRVETSPDLTSASWSTAVAFDAGATGPYTHVHVDATARQRFYRVTRAPSP